MENSNLTSYLDYLNKITGSHIGLDLSDRLSYIFENTDWDEPHSGADFNNFAVMALVEAEDCENSGMRQMYLEMAIEALQEGIDTHDDLLCQAHFALVLVMTGEKHQAMQMAFSLWVAKIHDFYEDRTQTHPALIYLPSSKCLLNIDRSNSIILKLLSAQNSETQGFLLLIEIICQSQTIFYNAAGLRILHLAAQIFPDLASVNLKLGIASLMNGQPEGILYLHRAQKSLSNNPSVLQALYLAYRDLKDVDKASFWLEYARKFYRDNPQPKDCLWTDVSINSNFTYVLFDDFNIALEPSFNSIATSVLIAEKDWFESEMEFWRTSLKPGMTAIDVGANVGVYTFSAAQKVGSKGKVLAIEPFSGCVQCLQETCRIDRLDWVKVVAAAASDRPGTARLSLYSASELNQLVADDSSALQPGDFEEVECLTLDSLIEAEQLQQVDFLKIDAEGHELSVLRGATRILSEFKPIILYENIAGSKGSNLPVAKYLREHGYHLFYYKPYVNDLESIESAEEFNHQLNIIAIANENS
ncbi:FkbM family methyltransferase [Oxynema sp. CENA135]|uniref:FkbM family methyltransferase n=1 Tax=Oxynema sp. CENA135 TaxID=984206 RepID=UPI0019091832|nr:FkbM family methyltransferase [Oxynema sp. CENA135]MBK4732136.1 FkbM family methyltransferase [Oxynema sp. CENA135]